MQIALMFGVYPTLDLAPKQKEAMEAVGMETERENVKGMLIHATASLLRGLTN